MIHSEVTFDMYTGREIRYPMPQPLIRKYDFVFTKDGKWRYISSSDEPKWFHQITIAPVEAKGEKWRIVEAATGEIVESNDV